MNVHEPSKLPYKKITNLALTSAAAPKFARERRPIGKGFNASGCQVSFGGLRT